MRQLVVRTSDGLVVNVVELAGGSNWTPPPGTFLLNLPGEIGDTWDGFNIIPQPQPPGIPGEVPAPFLKFEDSEVLGAKRLVTEWNGRKTAIVGAVGADSSLAAMYQSPGPTGSQPAGPRREFHVSSLANIPDIPTLVVDGDTLYVENDGEYRFTHGAWRRILVGPQLGTAGDTDPLYGTLFAAIDALGGGGPPVNPKIIDAFTQLKIVLGG